MEKRTDSPYPKIDRPVLAAVGVLLVISCALFAWSDRKHDWRYYQAEFKRRVADKLGSEKAKQVRPGLQQIWVADLKRADRCITCHQAALWRGFETDEEPLRTHSPAPFKAHPVEKYGCTSCHAADAATFALDEYTAKSFAHVTHLSNGVTCNICHRLTASSNTMINASGFALHHVNGTAANDVKLSRGGAEITNAGALRALCDAERD